LTIYWNNRATSQDATKERQKICLCRDGIGGTPTNTPTIPKTKKPSTKEPSVSCDPLPKSNSFNCDKFHLYPVDTRKDFVGSSDSDELSNDAILFPHVSTGIKFTAAKDVVIIGARLRAALAKGTRM